MKHCGVRATAAGLMLAAVASVCLEAPLVGAQPEARRLVVFESFMTPG